MELHDDWGSQISTLISPAVHREMIVPFIKKLTTALHNEGMFYEQHSCGKVDTLVPNMIEAGIDTWCGQEICDKKALVEQYGDRMKFGITYRTRDPISDEQLHSVVDNMLNEYRDKRVWMGIGGPFTDSQNAYIADRLANQPV